MGVVHIAAEIARGLVRLAGEIGEIETVADKKLHAVQVMRRMVGGELSCWLVDSDFGAGRRGLVSEFVAEGYPDWLTQQCIEQYVAQGSIADPAVAAMMRQRGELVGGARQELCSNRRWDRDPFVNEVRRPAGLDDSVYAMRATGQDGVFEGLCITRAVGDRVFADRERDAVAFFVAECARLFRPPLSSEVRDRCARLSPRHQRTLEALLEGLSERRIAERYRLSPHTVHQYVKELYRALEVRSRPELLARCLGARAV